MADEWIERARVLRKPRLFGNAIVLAVELVEALGQLDVDVADALGAHGTRVVRERPRQAPGAAPIVIEVGGARVEVGGDVDRDALRVVLEVLADASSGAES